MSEQKEVALLTLATENGVHVLAEYDTDDPLVVSIKAGKTTVISTAELEALRRDAGRYRWLRYHLLIVDLDGKEPTAADNERFDKTIAITGAKP